MRTTLDVDDDILQATKEMAEARGKTAGQMVSGTASQRTLDDHVNPTACP